MKIQWPHIVFTHCLAHRLELAFKDAVRKTSPKLYEEGTTLLLGLYYLFKKSPKLKKGYLSGLHKCLIVENLMSSSNPCCDYSLE